MERKLTYLVVCSAASITDWVSIGSELEEQDLDDEAKQVLALRKKVREKLNSVEAGANAAGANAVGQSDIQEKVKAAENKK